MLTLCDTTLSDEEFVEIQRTHFRRKTDERARQRAAKSLASCLDAIAAFREITGLSPITLATPDDCASFQRLALMLPTGWRKRPLEDRRPVEDFSMRNERPGGGRVRSILWTVVPATARTTS